MNSAGHLIMIASRLAPTWDYRVKYIESINSAAYFYLNEALTNLTNTPTAFDSSWIDLWEVVLGVSTIDTTDKHLFGKSYAFGLSLYNGKWRPSYTQDWPTNLNIPLATYNPVMFRAETGNMRFFTADGQTQLWLRTGNYYVRFSNSISDWSGKIMIGILNGDNSIPVPSQYRATNRVYSFRRVCLNIPQFTFIPCVKDNVPGLYDMVSRTFCASTSGTNFVAGPRVNDDGTDII